MMPDQSANDRELGMHRPITRRDFLNGIAVGAAFPAKSAAFPQDIPGYAPTVLTGMRGSHDGSYSYAHALRDGAAIGTALALNETYDLIVVGAGISGLAAAYFWRKQRPSSKILLLDNHDDFGGHAKRNEFRMPTGTLIANGGTLEIDSPFDYSPEAAGLLAELAIDPPALQKKSQASANGPFRNLESAFFFDKETFGLDRLVKTLPRSASNAPLSEPAKADLHRLHFDEVDYLPGLSSNEKKDRLSRISYQAFLRDVVKVHPQVIAMQQARTHGLYGIGIDAVAALELWPGAPGFQGMKLEEGPSRRLSFTAQGDHVPKKPYRFHFPDGNATIARLLVRALIPSALPGHSVEDSILAKTNYSHLDRAASHVRIRLGSTCLRAKQNGSSVEVTYGREKQLYNLRAQSVVLACWNMMIPYLCPELPPKQREALHYGVKVPLVYTVVALRNWTAFQKLGIRSVQSPGMYHSHFNLERPTNIGAYHPAFYPDACALVRMLRAPCKPGLPARDQHRAGHADLLSTPFTTFERNIRDQLVRTLADGGFQPARDIEAITVNRWPHGYAYEYNYLWDPEWAKGEAPCEIGRKQFGRISIANSDAAAAAYTDQAIDQAHRAVKEQLMI